MRTKAAIVAVGLVAGAILLVSVSGLPQEAAAVLVGIGAGVAAGIPTSILLLVLLDRKPARQHTSKPERRDG